MKVKTKDDILTAIENNKLSYQNLGVKRIGVFGSFVRDEQKKVSDIDLLVDFVKGKKTYKNFIKTSDLSERLFGRRVDLLTEKSLSPHIAPHVVKEIEYVQIAG